MTLIDPTALFSLTGRTALVTGGGGHLGGAIASTLAGAGAHVYLAGRSVAPLEELQGALVAEGAKVDIAQLDVLDSGAIEDLMARIGAETGRMDVLVNNAHSGKTGTIESAEPEDYANAFAVSVQAVGELTKKSLDLLKAGAADTGQASVINISSMYGMVSPDPSIYGDTGHNSPPYYGAAKAGLLQLTRYGAVHLAQYGVRVNAISPGPFPKPKVAETMPELWQTLCNKAPLGRVGQRNEIGGAALFLASDASSYVTGINLPVDGGWTAW